MLRSTIVSPLVRSESDVERIVLDRCSTESEYLSLLAELPLEFTGDVLMIRESGTSFLSATGRGGGRILYALTDEDVEFYLETVRLVDRTDLQIDSGFTAAFPAEQGAEVVVGLRNGKVIRQRLDNVIAATPQQIRARFRQSAADVVGDKRARHLEELVDNCELLSDGRVIAAQCRLEPMERLLRPAS